MANNEKDLEERLLSKSSLDELIKLKMEEELKNELKKSQNAPEKKTVTDISKVPKNLIFSKLSVFKMFNRINKTETYINGVQAEAMLGLQTSVRDKIGSGEMDAFSTADAYVKFEEVQC